MTGANLLEAVAKVNRRTRWELVRRVPLRFPTYHPQGLAFVGDYIFLSAVQVSEAPLHAFDPLRSTPGSGIGHMFVADLNGRLIKDIHLGEGDMYHPGGIDFDGHNIWVPVGEYRPAGNSILLSVDPNTFKVSERFRIKDSIGWAISDPRAGTIHGGNWGSRTFYSWGADGEERQRWTNPSSFIDYQDCQFVEEGRAIAGGIAVLPLPSGQGEYELGGLAIVDFKSRRILHEAPIQIFSKVGHVMTRNPFAVTFVTDCLFLHVAPDDGTEVGGTELLTFKAEVR